VAIRLQPEGDGEPSLLPPLFLASIEEMYLLKAIGRDALADAAAAELASRSP
jgi:hypothetical protein